MNRFFGLVSFVIISTNIPATIWADDHHHEDVLKSTRVQEALRYSVNVQCRTSNVFAPDVEGCHGTGLIYSLSPTEGIVFTNRHVIESGEFDARNLKIRFNVAEGIAEELQAELVFKSRFYDFAVLKFDPRRLIRSKEYIRPGRFLNENDFMTILESGQGYATMAFGNPFEGKNISTFGTISGKTFGRDWPISKVIFWGADSMINTDASVNPGNSGGPFVLMRTGEVLGLNTAGMLEANPHNYVTPILPLIAEWTRAKEDPFYHVDNFIPMRYQKFSRDFLKAESLEAKVLKEIPKFFHFYNGILMVGVADAQTRLERGDIILRVNGEPIGDNPAKYHWLVQTATGDSIPFRVIRNKKVISVQVPIENKIRDLERSENNYVSVAGLIVQDMSSRERESLASGKPGVVIRQILPHSFAAQAADFSSSAVIFELIIEGRRYSINNLSDFKRALRKAKRGKFIRASVYDVIVDQTGRHMLVRGEPILDTDSTIFMLPFDELITSRDVSLRELKKEFDFGPNFLTRDWRSFRKAASCVEIVKKASKSRKKP